MLCCRIYKPATADPVSDNLRASDDNTNAAATDNDDGGINNDAYYQFPLLFEQIYWVDSADSFHSAVGHIVQVYIHSTVLHAIDRSGYSFGKPVKVREFQNGHGKVSENE